MKLESKNDVVGVASHALFGLELHASALYERLQKAVATQRTGRVELPLEDVCGAIQIIQAGQSNLRDAERLNYLETMVADWPGVLMRKMPTAVFYGPQVSIRDTIDVAMSNDPNVQGMARREGRPPCEDCLSPPPSPSCSPLPESPKD